MPTVRIRRQNNKRLPTFLKTRHNMSRLLRITRHVPRLSSKRISMTNRRTCRSNMNIRRRHLTNNSRVRLPSRVRPMSCQIIRLLNRSRRKVVQVHLSRVVTSRPRVNNQSITLTARTRGPALTQRHTRRPVYGGRRRPGYVGRVAFRSYSPLPGRRINILTNLPWLRLCVLRKLPRKRPGVGSGISWEDPKVSLSIRRVH